MTRTYLALCGGVGGSKLADGLARILPPEELTLVVNTADDFDHLGLRICPDLDTVSYMLGGLVHPERGWGRADESWACMRGLEQLGGEAWFQLGDRDLALHLYRTQRLKEGSTLAAVTAEICTRLGITHVPVPMSEAVVGTIINTDLGELSFQDYFVRKRCAPPATDVRYAGAAHATPSERFLSALRSPDLAGVIVAPSNPILSIAPILSLRGVSQEIRDRKVPVVAVSPLIGGRALKGPADKLMAELRQPPGNSGIVAFYNGFLDGLIIDQSDRADADVFNIRTIATDTMMKTDEDRKRVARLCLSFLDQLD